MPVEALCAHAVYLSRISPSLCPSSAPTLPRKRALALQCWGKTSQTWAASERLMISRFRRPCTHSLLVAPNLGAIYIDL